MILFPQIERQQPPVDPNPVIKSLQKFISLVPFIKEKAKGNCLAASGSELFSQNILDSVLQYLQSPLTTKQPIFVLGVLPEEKMVEQSWKDLGLDLFDLPWFNPRKAFFYVRVTSMFEGIDRLVRESAVSDGLAAIFQSAADHLKWAQCHKVAGRMQEAVGHGNRDRLQSMSCEKISGYLSDAVSGERDQKMVCQPCLLLKQARTLLSNVSEKDGHERCPELAREIANLDCRKYRLAQGIYFEPARIMDSPSFQRIIILEDNEGFRRQLQKDLTPYVENGRIGGESEQTMQGLKQNGIICADPDQSLRKCSLCDKAGNDILYQCIANENVNPNKILLCFDLYIGKQRIGESGGRQLMHDFIGGHWILYSTAIRNPGIPKLVITGYRFQDITSYGVGAHAYVMKPYTPKTLAKGVVNACRLVHYNVKWYSPFGIEERYAGFLAQWLRERNVTLEPIRSLDEKTVLDSDLIVLDVLGIDQGTISDREKREIEKTLSRIRDLNQRVIVLVVVPDRIDPELTVGEFLRGMPLSLHDGKDAIIRKPMWIVADGHPDADAGLGNVIVHQLSRLNALDIKYQVLVPVAALIGRFTSNIGKILCPPKDMGLDEVYAPLLPFLIYGFGLYSNFKDISGLGAELIWNLRERLREHQKQEPERWEGIKDDDVCDVLKNFHKDFGHVSIQRHLNLEKWLRKIVDDKPNKVFREDNIHTLTEPLARVFGGSTRYEFSVRGSWYKGVERIDDILIVVEFCARSSIMARKFIRETAVNYLRRIAGEDVVLVQEIPIRGFLW